MKNLNPQGRIAAACLFCLLFVLTSLFSNAQNPPPGKISSKIAELKKAGVFGKEFHPFNIAGVRTEEGISKVVSKYTLLEPNDQVKEILASKPDYLKLVVPVDNGARDLSVLLFKENVSPNGFELITSDGHSKDAKNNNVHYRGSIENDGSSVASFSFSPTAVMGLISNNEGNFVLGQLEKRDGKYIIYNDRQLIPKNNYGCFTDTQIPDAPSKNSAFRPLETSEALTSKCVNWYWEINYDLFVNKDSLPKLNSYIQGVFNQIATLYANDGVSITLKTLFVWTTEDPYTGTTTSNYLDQFGAYRTSFNGDLANLIGLKGNGGIAWIGGLCSSAKYKQAYSGISSGYNAVPTFSWTVECIAHEEGHLLGSRHTHDCAWNGNNTEIDGCGDAAGYKSGSCTTAPLPTGGGTIMSYCHLTSAGINFNFGFGPQPKAVILNSVNNSSCLVTCNSCATPSQPGSVSGSASICGATSQTYSVAAVSGATSYSWTLPSGWTGSSTTNSITVTTSSTGGTLAVTANNSCGSSTAQSMIVTVAATPAKPGAISGNGAVCASSSQTYSVAAVSGATSYTWTLPSGWTGSSATNSITAATSSSGGTISVKANNNCGSSTAQTLAVTITSSAAAQPGTISGNASVCGASSQTYSVAAVSGASGYAWTLPSGWSGTSSTNSITVTAGSTGGTVSVSAINGCGTSIARTLDVVVNTLPATPGSITVSGGPSTVCRDEVRTYTTPLVSGVNYAWTIPLGSAIVSGQGSNSLTLKFDSTYSGTRTLSVKASNVCGTSSARSISISKNVPPQPGQITVSGGSSSVCPGDQRTYTTPLVTGITYNWTIPTGATVVSGQGTNSLVLAFNSSFTSSKTLYVRSVNACGTSSARGLTISRNAAATPSGITSNGSNTVCSGYVRTYTVTAVSGITYNWTVPAGSTINSGQGSNSISVLWGSAGGYVSVTANNACGTSGSRSLAVTVNCSSAIPEALTAEANVNAMLYPNPASSDVTVKFNSKSNVPYVLSIKDITGRTIISEKHSATQGINLHRFDLAGFAKGSYLVNIQSKGVKQFLKVVIQ